MGAVIDCFIALNVDSRAEHFLGPPTVELTLCDVENLDVVN